MSDFVYAALVLGDPTTCELFTPRPDGLGLWAAYPTHYRLWTAAGWKKWSAGRDLNQSVDAPVNKAILDAALASGDMHVTFKHWGCLENEYPMNPKNVTQISIAFDCGYQGVSVGWADVYFAGMTGQWVILDGFVKGKYMLEISIDPYCEMPDKNRLNNSVNLPFSYGG